MLQHIKAWLRLVAIRRLGLERPMNHATWSYAQEGEDILLNRILRKQLHRPGVYVDVGCNHPWKYSNTALLYLNGWSGTVIDPNPSFANLFTKERPRDRFVNLGVSSLPATLDYFKFEQDLFNTFSAKKAQQVIDEGHQESFHVVTIEVEPLPTILERVWPGGRTLDLLSIDAEGFDLRVIESHDFNRFPCRILLVEVGSVLLRNAAEEELCRMIEGKGFQMISKIWKSAMFVHKSAMPQLLS